MMEKLLIFVVLKPQGIKGDMKIKLYTDSFDSVKKIKKVYDEDGNEYGVKSIRDDTNNFAVIYLDNIVDRNRAEDFRGKFFYALKEDIKKSKDSFFVQDLIGLDVVYKDNIIGKITDVVTSNVAMFEFTNNNKKGYFPFLKKLDIDVDMESNKVVVNSQEFEGVVFYED